MHTLQAMELKLDMLDFVNVNGLIAIDMKFDGKETFEAFLEFSEKHSDDDTSLDYGIDGEMYHGHFGLIVYDVNYNVRFYMTTNPEKNNFGIRVNIWKENATRIIENQRNAIEKIANILCNAKLATKDDMNEILQCIPIEEYGFAIGHRVPDLQKYLIDEKETMEDLRQENM